MQFGPRIRVGGTLGKVGQKVKNFSGNAWDQLTPDVSVGGTKFALNPFGAPTDYAAAKLQGQSDADAARAFDEERKGFTRTGALIGSVAAPMALGPGAAANGAGGGAGGAGGGANAAANAGGWAGALKTVGNFLPLGLGAWSAYEGYKGDKRAQELQDRALALAEQRDRELAPLRAAAMQRLQNAAPSDLSALGDTGNPYYRRIPRVGSGA